MRLREQGAERLGDVRAAVVEGGGDDDPGPHATPG